MKTNATANDARIRVLERYGSPGSLSRASALSQYFPHVLWHRGGYWVYVVQKSPVPFVRDTVFLIGDPICAPEDTTRFVEDAVNRLSARGHVAALQVHQRTALAFQKT